MRRFFLPFILFLVSGAAVLFFSQKNHKPQLKEFPYQYKRKQTKYEASLERIRHEFEMTKDPKLGYVPRERLIKAKKYADFRRKQLAKRFSANGTPIPGVTWDERGPNNVGGRTRAIMFDPNDASNQRVYAGGVAGGLWRNENITVDGGWSKIDDFWDNLAVTSMDYDPTNTMNFYVGTGEGFGNYDAVRGDGIWKSSDGGANWSQLASTDDSYNFRYVNDLVVADDGSVLAGTSNGVHRSVNGGSSWIFQVLPEVIRDLEKASNVDVYAGTATGDIFKSTDNGTTWSAVLTTTAGRVEIACAPSNAQHVYAVGNDGSIAWIKKSEDGGATWVDKTIPPYTDQSCTPSATADFARGQGWYDLIIQVKEDDPNAVIIGGIDLLRSMDGGDNWSLISYWTGNCDVWVHADQHNLLRRPGSTVEMINSNDGGVYYTPDAWAADPVWETRNSGYNVTQGYACAVHPDVGSDYFLMGNQDNGTQQFSTPGVNSTYQVTGGDGGFPHIDQNDGNIQITAYTNNNYSLSTNGGSSFTGVPGQGGGRFINPTDYDDNAQKLYAAKDVGNYLRWEDPAAGGTSFTTVDVSNFPGLVSAVSQSPNIGNRIYFGFPDGSVYYVDDAHTGTSKTATLFKSPLGSGYISSIDIEDGNENHVIVTSSSYGTDQIVETTDGGASWTVLDNNLPDMPVRWGIFAPGNSDQILLATELGVWSTDNINGTATMWDPTNSGLANVRTDMLQVRKSDNLIAAATHGRGLYTSSTFQQTLVNFGNNGAGSAPEEPGTGTDGTCALDYVEIEIPISISINPSASVTVNITPNATSGALELLDYVLVDQSVVFTNGGPLTQFITLRILDDAIQEPAETIVLDLSVVPNAANVMPGDVSQYTHTIEANDNDPTLIDQGKLIYEENFDGSIPSTWTLVDLIGGGNWVYDDSSPANSANHSSGGPINSNSGDGWLTFPSDRYGNDGLPEEAEARMPVLDCSQYQNVKLEFNQFFKAYNEMTRVLVSNDGINFTSYTILNNDNLPSNTNTPNPEFVSLDISAQADNQSTVYIRFYWKGNWDWWWQVDDVKVKGDYKAPIAINTGQIQKSNLGAGETGHFYDANGDIIASINNTGSDVGCIEVYVETEGTGRKPAGFAPGKFYTDKTIRVNADNDQSYDITLYYTQNEMNIWPSPNTLNIVKSTFPLAGAVAANTTINTATVSNEYEAGEKYSFTASFTGFSSFALTDAEAVALPLELLDFTAERVQSANRLVWHTAREVGVSHFEIERSIDGKAFESIGEVHAGEREYRYIDRVARMQSDYYYYRLRIVDRDGSYEYSPVVSVKSETLGEVSLYPNPFEAQFQIDNVLSSGPLSIKIYNLQGQLVEQIDIAEPARQVMVRPTALGQGVYYVELWQNNMSVKQFRIVKN